MHNNTKHTTHTTAADNIPVLNEKPFSTSVEDLYWTFASIRAGLEAVGEDILEVVFAAGRPDSEALHALHGAMMRSYDIALKELRFAANVAGQRGTAWIANDAQLAEIEKARAQQQATTAPTE